MAGVCSSSLASAPLTKRASQTPAPAHFDRPHVASTVFQPLTLLIMNRSDWVMPGPPFRGTLSPPATSICCELRPNAPQLGEARNTHNVDDVVGELARVVGCEVVTAALDKQELGVKLGLQLLEGVEVCRNVLADRGVRAPASLDGADALLWQRLVADQELLVLARKDVVGDCSNVVLVAQGAAEGEEERRLARADGAADADGEGALPPVAARVVGEVALRVLACGVEVDTEVESRGVGRKESRRGVGTIVKVTVVCRQRDRVSSSSYAAPSNSNSPAWSRCSWVWPCSCAWSWECPCPPSCDCAWAAAPLDDESWFWNWQTGAAMVQVGERRERSWLLDGQS